MYGGKKGAIKIFFWRFLKVLMWFMRCIGLVWCFLSKRAGWDVLTGRILLIL